MAKRHITAFDLNLLVVFDALMRERSVTRAGAAVGLSQPSMSNALSRLRELPVSVVHGGHFGSFGRQRMHELVDQYLGGRRAGGCPGD